MSLLQAMDRANHIRRAFEREVYPLEVAIARDKRVSLAARGLLIYLLCLPDGAETDVEPIAADTGSDLETIRRLLGELIAAGYVKEDGGQMIVEESVPQWARPAVVAPLEQEPAQPVRRRKFPTKLRKQVFERDGYRCVKCGSHKDLSLDHIFPFSLGGEETLENLQTMCRPCNSSKGARLEKEA